MSTLSPSHPLVVVAREAMAAREASEQALRDACFIGVGTIDIDARRIETDAIAAVMALIPATRKGA